MGDALNWIAKHCRDRLEKIGTDAAAHHPNTVKYANSPSERSDGAGRIGSVKSYISGTDQSSPRSAGDSLAEQFR